MCRRLCSPVLTLWKPESLGSEEIKDSEEEEPREEGVCPGSEDMASVSASEKGSRWCGLSGPQPSPLSSSLRGRYPRRRSDCHRGRQADWGGREEERAVAVDQRHRQNKDATSKMPQSSGW